MDSKSVTLSIPNHVAIIMDGNGRWAKQRMRPRVWGHSRGAESVRKVVEAAQKYGVKVLTLFAFSEENWGRPGHEISAIFGLLDRYLYKERAELIDKNIKFSVIGEATRLPIRTQMLIAETCQATSHCTGLNLNIALSYSGKSDILQAARRLATKVKAGELQPEEINFADITSNLYTTNLPDPDLLIRTSGELRISNFMLWQAAYTELYFTSVLWPDFREEHFREALTSFTNRQRRYGLVEDSGLIESSGSISGELPVTEQVEKSTEISLC